MCRQREGGVQAGSSRERRALPFLPPRSSITTPRRHRDGEVGWGKLGSGGQAGYGKDLPKRAAQQPYAYMHMHIYIHGMYGGRQSRE